MKKIKVMVAGALLLSSQMASADPGVFFGVVYNFGSGAGVGFSLKVLSTDKQDNVVVGAGASFYPFSQANKFGIDADIGYLTKDFAVTVGWDFLQHGVQLGAGYVDTADENVVAPATAPLLPPPPPSNVEL